MPDANPRIKLIIAPDPAALARQAAARIAAAIRRKPNLTLIPATGNTPIATYKELAAMRARGELDASQVRVFQLDDYVGSGPDDPYSLYRWMRQALLEPLGIGAANVTRLAGEALDLAAACGEYDRQLREAGGADLAVLGLGPNGHLGFNEPPSAENSGTREVTLTPASIASNAPYWGGADRVPTRAVTAGMWALLQAREILLLVTGTGKRGILRETLYGPITGDVPASFLQRCPQATVLADRAAVGG